MKKGRRKIRKAGSKELKNEASGFMPDETQCARRPAKGGTDPIRQRRTRSGDLASTIKNLTKKLNLYVRH